MNWLRYFFYFLILLIGILLFPFTINLHDITFTKNSLPIAHAKKISLKIAPINLLSGKATFKKIEITGAQLLAKLDAKEKISYPKLPFNLEIHELIVHQLIVDHKEINFKAQCELQKNGGALFASIELQDQDTDYHLLVDSEGIDHNAYIYFLQKNPQASIAIQAQSSCKNWINFIEKQDGISNEVIKGKVLTTWNEHPFFKTFGQNGRLTADFTVLNDRSTLLEQITLKSNWLHINGSLTLNKSYEFTHSNLSIECADVNKIISLPFQAHGSFEGTVSGNFKQPVFDMDFWLLGHSQPIYGHIKTSSSKNGCINFKTIAYQQPLEFSAGYSILEETIALNELHLDFLDSNFEGDCCYFYTKKLFDGTLKATLKNLSQWETIFPSIRCDGWVDAKLMFTIHEGKQNLETILVGKNLHYSSLSASHLAIHAKIQDLFETSSGQATINVQGNDDCNYQIISQIKTAFRNDCCEITIEKLSGNYSDLIFQVAKPIFCEIGCDKYEIKPFEVSLFDDAQLPSSLCGFFSYKNEQLNLLLETEALPLSLARHFSPAFSLKGICAGKIAFFGKVDNLQGNYFFSVNNISHTVSNVDLPDIHFEFKGNYQNQQFTVLGLLNVLHEQLIIEGLVPYDLHQLYLTRSFSQIPLKLQLHGQSTIEPWLQMFKLPLLNIRGDLGLNLEIDGYLHDPKITGQLSLKNGSMESISTGAVLDDITLILDCNGKNFAIETMTASDGKKGQLVGKGAITFDKERLLLFDVEVLSDNLLLIEKNNIIAKANAYLTLKGDVNQVQLTGKAIVTEAFMFIPDEPVMNVPQLNVIYINNFDDCINKPSEYASMPFFNVDLMIEIPGNLNLEGRGLNSRWKGDIVMRGNLGNITCTGTLETVDGTFIFIGREFELNEGKIILKSLNTKDIYINLNAKLQLQTVEINANIKGLSSGPDISFNSNPPMKTNEILSWILFDSDISEISPFQAMELAHSLINISGNNNGNDILGKIKSILGLDVLNIKSSGKDKANIAFQAGKYISERLYFGVNKSVSGEGDAFSMQAKITKRLMLQAEVGRLVNGKLALKWQRAY